MRVRNTRTYKKVHIFSKNAAKIRKIQKLKSPTNGSVEPFLRLLSLEAPPRFELGDQSFAVTFRGAIIVDIEPFLRVRQLKKSENVGKYAT